MLLKALRPYKRFLTNGSNITANVKDHDEHHIVGKVQINKSRFFYKALVRRKAEKASISKKWKETNAGIDDHKSSFHKSSFHK